MSDGKWDFKNFDYGHRIFIVIIFRHEVVGFFEVDIKFGGSLFDGHGLLVVGLVLLGGIMFFTGKEERRDEKNEKQKVDIIDAWDTSKNDLLA